MRHNTKQRNIYSKPTQRNDFYNVLDFYRHLLAIKKPYFHQITAFVRENQANFRQAWLISYVLSD